MEKRLKIRWAEKAIAGGGRAGAMYCFERCDVNQN